MSAQKGGGFIVHVLFMHAGVILKIDRLFNILTISARCPEMWLTSVRVHFSGQMRSGFTLIDTCFRALCALNVLMDPKLYEARLRR